MKKVKILGMVSLFFLISVSLGGTVQAADKVTLMLNWFYVGDHSPYVVATEKGWYKDENLEVNIVPGKGSGDVVKKIDVGSAEFGIVDVGVLIVARAQGAKVKGVSQLFDTHPYCMWMWKDSGINSVKA